MCRRPCWPKPDSPHGTYWTSVNRTRFHAPVLSKLVRMAVEHLDQGWLYAMAIPRHETRLRLSCMWPILSAGEIAEARHEFARISEPRRESENPSEQGLSDHGAHSSSPPAPGGMWELPVGEDYGSKLCEPQRCALRPRVARRA